MKTSSAANDLSIRQGHGRPNSKARTTRFDSRAPCFATNELQRESSVWENVWYQRGRIWCFLLWVLLAVVGCNTEPKVADTEKAKVATPLERLLVAMQNEDWELANQCSQEALIISPEDPDLLTYAAKTAAYCNRKGEAAQLLVDAASHADYQPTARVTFAVQALIDVGDLYPAINLLEASLKQNPEAHDQRRSLVGFLCEAQRMDLLPEHLVKLYRARQFDVRLLLAVTETTSRRLSPKTSERLMERNPDDHRVRLAEAFVMMYRHDSKAGAEILEDVLEHHPKFAPAHAMYGQALMAENRLGDIPNWLDTATPQSTKYADYWLTFIFDRLGRNRDVYEMNKKNTEAPLQVFASICGLVGQAYLEFGCHAAARQAFKRSVRVWPEFADGHYLLGVLHIKKLRNPKRAVKYLEMAEQLYIRQNDFQRAALVHQLYRPKEEVQEKNKAAEEWLKEGLRLQNLTWYQAAVDAYQMARGFKPDFLDAYYNMGVAYGCMEENGIDALHKAVWVFKKSIDLNPEFIHAYTALGASYIKQGDTKEAIEILNRAEKVCPEDSNVYFYLGIASRIDTQFEKAVVYLKNAVALKPDSVQVQFYLGLSLLDAKLYDEACSAFRDVIRIKPDFADGHMMLGNLYRENILDSDKAIYHLKRAERLFMKMEDFQRVGYIRQLLARSAKTS